MKFISPPIFFALYTTQNVAAFSFNAPKEVSTNSGSRKAFLQDVMSKGVIVSTTLIGLSSTPNAARALDTAPPQGSKIIGSGGKKCAYGEGDACDSLAGDNEFIKELQRKSSLSRESAQRESVAAYQMKNYPDFFASVGKVMVKKSDGTFELYDEAQLADLKKAGKIKLEIPKAMGGRVTDLTQKPILVLVD